MKIERRESESERERQTDRQSKRLDRVNPSPARHQHVTCTSTIRQLRHPGPSPFRCKNGLSLEQRSAGWQNVQAVPCPFSVFSDYNMAANGLTILYCLKRKRYNRRRRHWIHRINLQIENNGEFYHLVDELLIDEEKCLSYIAPYITKRETNFPKPIPASISASVPKLN